MLNCHRLPLVIDFRKKVRHSLLHSPIKTGAHHMYAQKLSPSQNSPFRISGRDLFIFFSLTFSLHSFNRSHSLIIIILWMAIATIIKLFSNIIIIISSSSGESRTHAITFLLYFPFGSIIFHLYGTHVPLCYLMYFFYSVAPQAFSRDSMKLHEQRYMISSFHRYSLPVSLFV